MSQTLKLSLIICILFISCHSTKNKTDDTNSRMKIENEKFLNAGYKLGLIEFNQEGKCVYTITDQSTKIIYDPINFMEIAEDDLKNDIVKVYFKFRPLRMMNRCENLQPIELIEIKKWEN